jgi:hypothetical protein
LAARAQKFAKLFTLYPEGAATEERVAVYTEQTRDIPLLVIRHALSRLTQRAPSSRVAGWERRDRAPSVAVIRAECARYLRERHRAANGLPAQGGLDWSDGELDDELIKRWLARAHEPLPPALSAGRTLELPAGPDERQRATARLQAEIDRMEKHMRAPR